MSMNKTTVYLPEDLKQSLKRMAAVTGRSEAELIREAVAAQVRVSGQPRPRGQLFTSGGSSLAEQADQALAGFGDR
jgi:plasmid stability protein